MQELQNSNRGRGGCCMRSGMACRSLLLCSMWRCKLISWRMLPASLNLADPRKPFNAKTPFVEKDGYAWCVNCHTHRFSTKCKKCRKPVVDTVVNALGAEWHEECFCCTVRNNTTREFQALLLMPICRVARVVSLMGDIFFVQVLKTNLSAPRVRNGG
jgi:hypothetical protein